MEFRLRLGLQVRGGEVCVRDLYDLMVWSAECPVTQQIPIGWVVSADHVLVAKDGLRRAVEVSRDAVLSRLGRGVNRREDSSQPIPELSWSMRLWSGQPDDESFSLAMHCGSFSQCCEASTGRDCFDLFPVRE